MRRPYLPTSPVVVLFFFLLSSSGSQRGSTSAARSSRSGLIHPADTVEEACHLFGESDFLRTLYPFCVAALRSAPESRNATLPKLAVLATALVQRDAATALRHMEALRSRGAGGGDQEELAQCLSDYGTFLSVMQGIAKELRRGGRLGIQHDFVTVQDYVDCRWMKDDPVKQQQEILALLWAAYGICNKYCQENPKNPSRCNF